MHRSINKKKIYFYLFILVFLSTIFNFKLINIFKNVNLIKSIEIQGIGNKDQNLIKKELQIFFDKNIFFVEKNEIIFALNKFNFLKNFNIKKIFPSKLLITAEKTNFLATTFLNGEKFYIGNNGKFTSVLETEYKKDLPMIFGKFSIKEFLELRDILLKQRVDINNIEKYFYHMSKRWDLQKNTGLIIKLPSKNIPNSLKIYNKLKDNNKLNSAKIVDLRISERIVLNYE